MFVGREYELNELEKFIKEMDWKVLPYLAEEGLEKHFF